jgi:hypothetical protein
MSATQGNGSRKRGYVNKIEAGVGWVVFTASPSEPPPKDEIPIALNQALEQWLREDPTVRVRATLPIVLQGQMVLIHIWYDCVPAPLA